MAVRKVSNRGGNIIGHYPSLKLGRMVAFESLLERDFVYLLDYEPAVMDFSEQPLTIRYVHENQPRRYTPDFQVLSHGHTWLCECKPAARVAEPRNQVKFAAARTWCQEQGWTFRVVTDVQLAANARVTNIKLLAQFARYPLNPAVQGRILAVLAERAHPLTIAEVMQQVQPQAPQAVLIPILRMAFHHEVHIPLNAAPITSASPITLTPSTEDQGAWLP